MYSNLMLIRDVSDTFQKFLYIAWRCHLMFMIGILLDDI